MPIETQRRGVVAELAPACLEDRLGEVLYGLAWVHARAGGQEGSDVQAGGVPLQHAVGDEDQPIVHLQWQRLHPVAASGQQSERGVSIQTNVFHPPGAKP